MMEFCVLGPLEVRDGDRAVPVGRGRRSALLALLLLHAGQALGAERLIDELWGEEAPPTARKALQVHVSALRRTLGAEVIVTRAGGYALELGPHELDVDLFEATLAAGRAALTAGDASAAATLLRDALAIWRGPPLADVAHERFAGPEIARLEELRAAADEDRIEAELALGHHAEAAAELERLIARDPLRERLRGQQMLALYRSGRQAEALAAYRAARRTLVEELGIEPGAALQELHRRMLAQDPGLEARAAAAALPQGNLPRPATSFVGRRRELEEIGALLARERLVTLHGPGGSGKTRLAIRTAERAAAGLPDGAWFVDLAPLAGPELLWAAVAAALGVQDEPGRTVAEGVLAALAPRTALIVLDNCEHVLDGARDVAAAILDRCPGVRLLATSREPLGDPREVVWPVPELAIENDAIQLFSERGSRSLPGYAVGDGDRAAVAAICRRLDGLPLAIELAAARLNVLAPAQIAERLDHRFRLLSRGDPGGPARHRTLWTAVDWSYALLAPDEQRALAQLAVFAGGFDLDAAEHVLDGDALELVSALVDKSLLARREHHGRARHVAHETIREFGAEHLDDADAVRARHLDWWVELFTAADEGMRGPDRAAWVARLAPDQDNVRQALAWGLAHARAESALELAWHAHHFWASRGNLSESERWLGDALAATDGAAPTVARTRALTRWGELAELRGAYEEARARYARALEMGRALGDPVREGVVELALGEMEHAQGSLEDARRHLERSDELLRGAGDPERARWPVEALARVDIAAGDTASARGRLEATRAAAQSLGNEAGVGEATLWLAEAARRDDDPLAARELYTEALGLAERTGVLETAARCRLGLGRLELDGDAPAAAARALGDALRFADDAGLRPAVPDCLEALAAVAFAAGDAETAARLLGAAGAIRELLGTVAWPAEVRRAARTRAAARDALGGARFATAHGAGRALAWGDAVALALTAAGGAA